MQFGPDFAPEGLRAGTGDGETAKGSRGGVVGMAFQIGTDLEEGIGVQGLAGEFVEAVQDPEPDGDGASHAAGLRDFAFDGPVEVERRKARRFEEGGGSQRGHGRMLDGIAQPDRDAVMDLECDTEGVIARAEVG